MHWIIATLCVSCYGIFRDLRPSEAYLSIYLTSNQKNLTIEQINGEVFPWWSYSSLVGLIPVSLLSDHVNYKPFLVLNSLLFMAKLGLVIWADSLTEMKLMEVCSGLAFATNVSYYSVLYSLVNKRLYKTVSCVISISSLLSKFAASLCGQLLVSYDVLDLTKINVLSLTSVGVSLIIAFLLPQPISKNNKTKLGTCISREEKQVEHSSDTRRSNNSDQNDIENNTCTNESITTCVENVLCESRHYCECRHSDHFEISDSNNNGRLDSDDPCMCFGNKSTETKENDKDGQIDKSTDSGIGTVHRNIVLHKLIAIFAYSILNKYKYITNQLSASYSSRTVMIWSLWAIFGTLGNFQNGRYIQNLWEVIHPYSDNSVSFNGAVKAAGVLIGAICVGLIGIIPFTWSDRGHSEILMTAVSALKAASYVIMARTGNIWIAYVFYAVIKIIVPVSMAVQLSQTAKSLPGRRYGFVLGCNLFCGLAIETLFTLIVVDGMALGVDVRTQFFIYGIYYSVHASVFAAVTVMAFLAVKKASLDILPTTGTTTSGTNTVGNQEIWSTRL